MYIDTHAHLFLQNYKHKLNADQILKESVQAGVNQIWLAGTNKFDNPKNLQFAKNNPKHVKCWVGFHPEEYEQFDLEWLEQTLKSEIPASAGMTGGEVSTKNQIQNLKENPNYQLPTTNYQSIVGIGEIGIDLNWHDKSTLKDQQQVFEDQINLALKYNLPVAVHSRDAYEQTKEVLEKYKDLTFVWHCYTLDEVKTKALLSTFDNIYFGFNAIITYKSGAYLNKSIMQIPKQKLVLETDSPFLAPRDFKNSYNTPEGVISVYEYVSNLLKTDVKSLVKQISTNCQNVINEAK